MTILVVDDSRLIRTCIKSLVRDFTRDCTYIEAENGEEALKLIQEQIVDFVFLDWEMPKMSGLQVLKEVRSMKRYKDLPIIMVTGANRQEDIAQAAACGVTDYILKPLKSDNFRERMSKHLLNMLQKRKR